MRVFHRHRQVSKLCSKDSGLRLSGPGPLGLSDLLPDIYSKRIRNAISQAEIRTAIWTCFDRATEKLSLANIKRRKLKSRNILHFCFLILGMPGCAYKTRISWPKKFVKRLKKIGSEVCLSRTQFGFVEGKVYFGE